VRKRLSLLVALSAGLLVVAPQVAQAGLFGGFANDGSYRRGDDQICKPVTSELGAPTCKSASTAQLSQLQLKMGDKQVGSKKKVSAKKSASKIKLVDAESDALLFTWDSGQVISAIGSVFLHRSGGCVAVEFTTRLGGRQIDDLVVIKLGKSLTPSAAPTPGPTPTITTPTTPTTPPAPKVVEPADPPAFTAAMKLGVKWQKRRKYPKAIEAYKAALVALPDHPVALYRLAHTYMAANNKKSAVTTLARIAGSAHKEAVVWRVEARFDIAFKSLRGDVDFRNAVGIDRAQGDPITLYEKLVAFGGSWEQERIPCEQPQVSLRLRREKKRRFDLVIRSKCQGTTETTRLDGAWLQSGDRNLALTFPNTESADEDLTCKLEMCSDDSGENCLRCQLDEDVEFLLRVVRR
jgi:tetratricopeptide (TPR) repeat protein